MSRIPFSIYDFFGYLASGLLLVTEFSQPLTDAGRDRPGRTFKVSLLGFSRFTLCLIIFAACTDSPATRKGDMAMQGGSPTVRGFHEVEEDDPWTTNDESNDQPTGYYGTVTLSVYSHSSSNDYTLDGDVEDGMLERLYFPKGGWVDFWDCELDEDLWGMCYDEEGRGWDIQGESAYAGTSWIGNEAIDAYDEDDYLEDYYSEDYDYDDDEWQP